MNCDAAWKTAPAFAASKMSGTTPVGAGRCEKPSPPRFVGRVTPGVRAQRRGESRVLLGGRRERLVAQARREQEAIGHFFDGDAEEERVATIVASLTREEKLNLLNGVGWDQWDIRDGYYVGGSAQIARHRRRRGGLTG